MKTLLTSMLLKLQVLFTLYLTCTP